MAFSPQDRNIYIVEKIINLLEQDLINHYLKLDVTVGVMDPQIRKKINRWKSKVKEAFLFKVSELYDSLDDIIRGAKDNEPNSPSRVARSDTTSKVETPMGILFSSTLINQAVDISASMKSGCLKLPLVEKNNDEISSAKETSNDIMAFKREVFRRKEFYNKKIKVLLIDMEEDLLNVFSGKTGEDYENFLCEERKLDLKLNSNKPFLNTIIDEMKPNDIIDNFWKLFIEKFFCGKVSSGSTQSSTRLGSESESHLYVAAFGQWKCKANVYLASDFRAFIEDFIQTNMAGNKVAGEETFSPAALLSVGHINKLMLKIVEESSRPEKEIESESRLILESIDSNEQRVFLKVQKEEAIESCKSFMRNQQESTIEYLKDLEKSVLKKGLTIESLRRKALQSWKC